MATEFLARQEITVNRKKTITASDTTKWTSLQYVLLYTCIHQYIFNKSLMACRKQRKNRKIHI